MQRTAGLVATSLLAAAAANAAGAPDHPGRGSTGSAWTVVTADAEWEGRAGLQAVEHRGDLFVMGGRGAFSVDGPTTIFQDVWKSRDGGRSWDEVSGPAEWPARGYFQALTHRGRIVVLGGQNFETVPNPIFPGGCASLPPGVPCLPFIPASRFFDDVWASEDGAHWSPLTTKAGWEGRAGLSAVVFKGEIFVLGGSQGDDAATGGTGRRLFNDVWKSRDGASWERVTAAAPWAPRAGGVAVVKNGYIWLLGGERGFTCGGAPGCVPERDLYFNDVWRSRDGAQWELVTAAAGWSARPGHQCVVALDTIVCFGGYGEPVNPNDVWASGDGRTWVELKAPFSPPWRAVDPDDAKYDFDALVVKNGPRGLSPAILTFGGDRERFDLPPFENATRVDNDVWLLGLPLPHAKH